MYVTRALLRRARVERVCPEGTHTRYIHVRVRAYACAYARGSCVKRSEFDRAFWMQLRARVCACACVCTRVCAYARTHARTRVCARMRVRMYARMRVRVCAHACACAILILYEAGHYVPRYPRPVGPAEQVVPIRRLVN